MKTKIFSLIAAAAIIALSACDDDSTLGYDRITYYPVLTLSGDATYFVTTGTEYTDPGFTAELNGEDVSDQVTVTSDVDMNQPGIYSIVYSIVNADGIEASASRQVVVVDEGDNVTGYYTVSAESYRLYNGTRAYGAEYTILIAHVGDGFYYCTDLLGGWYEQRAGYGSSYAMTGHFYINSDNSLSLYDSYISGWGDGLDDFSGSYDGNDTFSVTATYASSLVFVQIWTKQ